MSSFMRLLTGVALTGVALTALNRSAPEWVRGVGLDFWKLPDLWQDYHDGSHEFAEQHAQHATVVYRLEVRSKIVERVVNGSLSLFEAASAFRELNVESGAAVPSRIRCQFPNDSDEECLCQQVILWVESDLQARGESERAVELVTHLQAILGQHRREGIPIVLPPCPKL